MDLHVQAAYVHLTARHACMEEGGGKGGGVAHLPSFPRAAGWLCARIQQILRYLLYCS
jgi:hypothetical protein